MKAELIYPNDKREVIFDLNPLPNKGDHLDLYDSSVHEYHQYEVKSRIFYFHGRSEVSQRKIDFVAIRLEKVK